MTTLNIAATDTDTPHVPPVTFEEAWASVMTSRAKREWAFNHRIPSADELLRARENEPFSMSMFLDVPSDAVFDTTIFRVRIEDLCCTSRRLHDGTYLGFVLNSARTDFAVPCFAAFDPCFGDAQLNVIRLICGAVAGRLYIMEFCWLKSGALTVRFGPYQSLSTSLRSDLRVNHSFYAFLPSDVPLLSAMALCPGKPGEDFVNARFDRILLSEDWYTLKVSDTCFQTACVFCASRGLSVCGCPLPMRRRTGPAPDVIGYKQRSGKTIWDEFSTVKSYCAHHGIVIYNITKATHTPYAKVVDSGIFPFDTEVELNLITSNTMQMHLALTGQSVCATRTVLTPFNTKGGTKRQLMSAPSSRGNFTASTTLSSVDPSKAMTAMSSTSSSNELLSLALGARKRSRLRNTSLVAASRVPWDDDGTVGASVEVNITTTIITNLGATTTEALSSSDKSRRAAAGSSSEAQNRGPTQLQQQSKVYPCPECGALIKNKRYNLKRHIQVVHQKERKFACTLPNCGLRFQTKTNLQRHVSTVHKREQIVQEQDEEHREKQQQRNDAASSDVG